MNYQKHYDRLMRRARNRALFDPISGYSEWHHIIPKCLGGDNSKSNLAQLTPEEHYVAHLLLVKIYPGNHKILCAAVYMTKAGKGRFTNKLFGWLRRKHIASLSKTVSNLGAEWKRKLSDAALQRDPASRLHTKATRQKMSNASKGRRKSIAHRVALSITCMGRKISKETKLKMSIVKKGKKPSIAHRVALSEGWQNRRNRERV